MNALTSSTNKDIKATKNSFVANLGNHNGIEFSFKEGGAINKIDIFSKDSCYHNSISIYVNKLSLQEKENLKNILKLMISSIDININDSNLKL